MEEKGYGYIYKTTNLVNGKIYIGQHKHDKTDNSYIGGGLKLQKAIKKYGKENFKCEHIEECKDYKTLNESEIYWIAFYNSTNKKIGYNIDLGGKQGPTSPETRKKLSKALSGKNNPMYGKISWMKGKHHTKEVKQILKELATGWVPSEETRKKMSESHKGIIFSEEHRRKLSEINKGENNFWYGKVGPRQGAILSEETKQKISISHKGRKLTEEHKKKISQKTAGKNNPMYGRKQSEETKKLIGEKARERAKKKNENNNL